MRLLRVLHLPDTYSTDVFSNEHITPESRDGATDADNLALACQGCNNKKYNKMHALDPLSGETVPLFHPRCDDWHTHFVWIPDCLSLNDRAFLNLQQPVVVN